MLPVLCRNLQAYTNTVLALTDEGDRCVLFAPYYFNHLMAHQMTGGSASVILGPCDPKTLHPDLDWLEVGRPSLLLSGHEVLFDVGGSMHRGVGL